jgi:hypothetical protein
VFVLHLSIRDYLDGAVKFLLVRQTRWKRSDGTPLLGMPARQTFVAGGEARDGQSLEPFVAEEAEGELRLGEDEYLIDLELDAVTVRDVSPGAGEETEFVVYPVDVWLAKEVRSRLAQQVEAVWLTPQEILDRTDVSFTSRAVVAAVLKRETEHPERPLLAGVAEKPTMEMLALRWHARNRSGVRCVGWGELNDILAAGDRAFNLLVPDPYLRYQNQGYGLTFSFFTHKDAQDLHLHGFPTVEIYGVLSGGPLEIWWKPKHARGAGAWSRRLVDERGFIEVGPEQCHIVKWAKEGVGVVVKGGPGPLAGVGAQGVAGKTRCEGCSCRKPPELIELEETATSRWRVGLTTHVSVTLLRNSSFVLCLPSCFRSSSIASTGFMSESTL